MIRLLELTPSGKPIDQKVSSLQKKIDRLIAKQTKLDADLTKLEEREKPIPAKWEQLKNKFYRELDKAIKNESETIAKYNIEALVMRIKNIILQMSEIEDWTRKDSVKMAELNQEYRKLDIEEPAPEDDPWGRKTVPIQIYNDVYRVKMSLWDKADSYAELFSKIREKKQELQEVEDELDSLTAELDSAKETKDYLDYAPPEFWDAIQEIIDRAIKQWEEDNWTALVWDGRDYVEKKFTKQQVVGWYMGAAWDTIRKVSRIAGRIERIGYITPGPKLERIDGTYYCEKKNVRVLTFIAGGWNIQVEHTRCRITAI